MTITITSAATLTLVCALSKKNRGTPASAARLKHKKLPLGEVKHYFGLDFRQVFGYGNISHQRTSCSLERFTGAVERIAPL